MKKGLSFILLSLLCMISQAQRKTMASSVMSAGKAIYTQNCMTCHQVDGVGAQNMIPPLIKTDYVLGVKSTITKTLLNEDLIFNLQLLFYRLIIHWVSTMLFHS